MRIIDTHAHIYKEEFEHDIENIISRAQKAGVEKILLPNIDLASIPQVHNLTDNYPNYCYPMMGLHPTDVKSDWVEVLAEMKQWLDKRKYVAIGEIGMDLYWEKTMQEEQALAFEEQLRWSIEYDLPVAIHSRDAIIESIECINRVGVSKLRGVFHSFTGTKEEMHEILALDNFYLGINGVVTFKNSDLKDSLKEADLHRIVVETDAPYLAPVPYRGKRNESSYTREVVDKLSDIFEMSIKDIGDITTRNAERLFNL